MRLGGLFWVVLLFPLFSEGYAAEVNINTSVTLFRPAQYDGEKCAIEVFSKKISELGSQATPVLAARSKHDQQVIDPVENRGALVVEVKQATNAIKVLRIEGPRKTTKDIQKKLAQGTDLRLTEYKKCAKVDSSLQYVELVNLRPHPESVSLHFDATLQIVRKKNSGDCDVVRSSTLGDIIRGYNPGINLSKLSYLIQIYASSVDPKGELIGKRINILFKNKKGSLLSRPKINITVPSPLVYTVLDRLDEPSDVLTMTGVKACFGKRLDDPVRVLDLKFD